MVVKRAATLKTKGVVWAGVAVLALSALAGCASHPSESPSAGPPRVVLDEHKIPGPDLGIELYLREKKLDHKRTFSESEVVLFLEPFGVPSAEAFDVPGYSWMEELAKGGYDAWALDFRGFGKSTRPAAMEHPPLENPPVVRATDAIKDVEAAVEFIQKRRSVGRVSIIGWSWGAVVAGMYAAEHPEKVNKLVLYGAMHCFRLPSMTHPLEDRPGVLKVKLPAYQLATFEMTLHHWKMMLKGRELVASEAIEAVRKVFIESDPTSRTRTPHSIRRPVGPLVDLYYIWSDKPIYDAAKIKAPMLLIRGDEDFFADPTFLSRLTGTMQKKEVVITDATHWVLYEKNRDRLQAETANFLKAK